MIKINQNYDKLLQEIEDLKKQIKALNDEQVKQRRANEDLMYNLDNDNLSPTCVIRADHISLNGKTIDLTSGNITIQSDNFTVDANGNMWCTNANVGGVVQATGGSFSNAGINNCTMENCNIKKSCSLASDVAEGSGIKVGQTYANQAGTRYSYVDIEMADVSVTNGKGIVIKANNKLSNDPATHSGVIVTPEWTALTNNTEVSPLLETPGVGSVIVFDDGEVVIRSGEMVLTVTASNVIMDYNHGTKHWEIPANP